MRINLEKGWGWGLSIPAKVAAATGAAYASVWLAELALAHYGLVDQTSTLFGVGVTAIFTFIEAAAIAAAATLSIYRFLERPLVSLRRAMLRAERGDFLIRAPVAAEDEIGDLSRSFNRMLTRITDLSAQNIQSEQDHIMAAEQERLRRSLEEKGAIIERTNRMLEQFVKDLSLIYEIGQEVNSIIDLDRLYATIAATLRKHLKVNEFALMVFDEKAEELQIKAAFGFKNPEAVAGMVFRKGEGISGLAAQSGKKIYIKDTSREDRFLNYKGERPDEPSSFLSLPLIYKDEVLGVINFGRRGVSSFTYQDVQMLSLTAGQISLAIANARLYTRTRELTVKDELTGINNRRHFQNMLQMEWKRAIRFHRPLSLIMVDVDFFKDYNDTFGHLQGDQVLRQIGGVLRRNLREVDTVARFGGEEFVLLLPDTDKRGAIAVAEKVRLLVEGHRFATPEHKETRSITISAGIATYPDDVEEMDDLIDHADIALYRAKENGRNRIECYKALEQASREDELPEQIAPEEPAVEDKPKLLQ
ncbi:MAG: diguanylate cyclase [Proteobacteria bacterium]|nr:diguanylate cyclase [Pseudomonadota bacterium]